ncbi:MAG: GCN5-related N-acetyltransferase like domain, partial [Pseudonocardiales bacterium]|nr:GCN5-related N-acetyltransferase like domain [Pseudonocardiales bacterium]
VDRSEDQVRCASAVARQHRGRLLVSAGAAGGGGDGLDPLRALVVAAWALSDSGRPVSDLIAGDQAARRLLTELGIDARAD